MDHRSIHQWNSGAKRGMNSPMGLEYLAIPSIRVHGIVWGANPGERCRKHESNPQNEYWTDQCNYDKRKALHRSLGTTRRSTKIGNFHRFEGGKSAEMETHCMFSPWSTLEASRTRSTKMRRRTWMSRRKKSARIKYSIRNF